nr:XRE family transcriptional regulator [uncultured Draconibacterium sp.]
MEDVIGVICTKIKEVRLDKNLTLADVADAAGVTKGFLSKVENVRTVPSLPVLLEIIKALNVDMANFFEDIQASAERPLYVLIRKEDYKSVRKDDATGFGYFSIFQKMMPTSTFHANMLYLEPDAKRDLVTTDGLEFIYLVSGKIDYQLRNEEFTMEEGDSLFFDGRIPHLKKNPYGQTAKILVLYFLEAV